VRFKGGVQLIDANEAAQRAIDRVEAAALESWKLTASRAVKFVARRDAEGFTSEEVWAVLESASISPPSEPRALGAVFRSLKASGFIESTGLYRAGVRGSSSEVQSHGRPILIWVKSGVVE